MGKRNLTLQQLPDLIADPALSDEIRASVAAVVARAAFATKWRNKRIAHSDLAHSLNQSAEPLPPASLDDVAGVLRDMAAILNRIESHYCRATTWYEKSPITHGVMTLLHVVRDGLRREELRQARLEKTGEYCAEDWDDNAPAL
jgi:hypothetical protein